MLCSLPSAATAWGLLVGLAVVLPAALAARPAAEGEPALEVLVFSLEHQPASEAIPLVYPLLSKRGTVELQPAGNTLVVRDAPASLERIGRLLRGFDHPARRIRLEIQVVEAAAAGAGGPPGESLPEPLTRRLQELLRYKHFRLLARTSFEAREAERVTYRVGKEFSVAFQLGTLLAERRLRLHGFRLSRQDANPERRELIHTHLNLWLDEPMVLGLARAESSDRALMVILTSSLIEDGADASLDEK